LHLATPLRERKGGVLVLHSWWGLNDFFRTLCDRFAKEGFTALAPDLYDGKVAATAEDARKLRAMATASRREPAYKYLIRMIGKLQEAADVEDIAVVGFSMGGHWAYWLAQRPELPISATITFYAARNGDYTKSRSVFLAHFAGTDEWVSAATIRRLEKSLVRAGRPARFHTYPGTGHWFFEEDRLDAYRKEAATLAWERTVSFLT
jgi:carboxymethylenebutenolidase